MVVFGHGAHHCEGKFAEMTHLCTGLGLWLYRDGFELRHMSLTFIGDVTSCGSQWVQWVHQEQARLELIANLHGNMKGKYSDQPIVGQMQLADRMFRRKT